MSIRTYRIRMKIVQTSTSTVEIASSDDPSSDAFRKEARRVALYGTRGDTVVEEHVEVLEQIAGPWIAEPHWVHRGARAQRDVFYAKAPVGKVLTREGVELLAVRLECLGYDTRAGGAWNVGSTGPSIACVLRAADMPLRESELAVLLLDPPEDLEVHSSGPFDPTAAEMPTSTPGWSRRHLLAQRTYHDAIAHFGGALPWGLERTFAAELDRSWKALDDGQQRMVERAFLKGATFLETPAKEMAAL